MFAKVLRDFHEHKGLMAFTSFSGSQVHNNYWILCITFVLPANIDHIDFKHPNLDISILRQIKSFVINLE